MVVLYLSMILFSQSLLNGLVVLGLLLHEFIIGSKYAQGFTRHKQTVDVELVLTVLLRPSCGSFSSMFTTATELTAPPGKSWSVMPKSQLDCQHVILV